MTYSYTQISHYLGCPRRYRHRYLDGWREKDTRAAMLFGRVFEKALAAYFCREDSSAVLFEEWGAYRETPLQYSNGDSWEKTLRRGVTLLERFLGSGRAGFLSLPSQETFLCPLFRHSPTRGACRSDILRAALLHCEGSVEAELVPARLWL